MCRFKAAAFCVTRSPWCLARQVALSTFDSSVGLPDSTSIEYRILQHRQFVLQLGSGSKPHQTGVHTRTGRTPSIVVQIGSGPRPHSTRVHTRKGWWKRLSIKMRWHKLLTILFPTLHCGIYQWHHGRYHQGLEGALWLRKEHYRRYQGHQGEEPLVPNPNGSGRDFIAL